MDALRSFLMALCIAALAGPAAAAEIARIEGMANYEGDENPPPGAVLEIDLVDLSRVGEKGRLLSRMRFEIEDGVPAPFSLPYDTGLVRQGGRYSLAARIIAHNSKRQEVLWRTTAVFPVLASGLDPTPEIFMEQVVPLASGGTPVGYRWRVERVEGLERLGFTKARMRFDEDGTVSGNTGCNRFQAEYSMDGEKLGFSPAALSRRGCQPEIMRRERLFIVALKRTERFRREQDVLRLLDVNGLETMRLSRE
ncbi:MAG: META domain-containing protein [Pseudomonadota bacterium]